MTKTIRMSVIAQVYMEFEVEIDEDGDVEIISSRELPGYASDFDHNNMTHEDELEIYRLCDEE